MRNLQENQRQALVMSGGGVRGAWGGGVAKALSEKYQRNYHLVVGTSTGSLLAPLAVLNDYARLEEAYTSVTQKDIFNVNPFTKSGKVNYFNLIWRLIRSKETLGESQNLLKLIPKFFKEEDYEKVRSLDREFVATVVSLTNNSTAFQSTKDWSYNDIVQWIWASANTPIFMSNLHKDGQTWVDGGLKDYLPITYSINRGAKVIDIIVHNTKDAPDTGWKVKGGVFPMLFRILDVFKRDVYINDWEQARLEVEILDDVELNMYFMSHELWKETENILMFNKPLMRSLWDRGYKSLLDGTIEQAHYAITADGNMRAL